MALNYGSDQPMYHCAPIQSPPSPPMDSTEPRIWLPSIKSLIEVADNFDAPQRRRRASLPSRPPYSPTRTSMPPTPPVGSEGLDDSPSRHSVHFGAYHHHHEDYHHEMTPPLEDPARSHRTSMPPVYSTSGYYQRPLPTAFPPPHNNSWHGHYMTPAPTFQQSQDRYICPTCNKAFSRPSSLRIHNYSHTGEKPFKCPVNGCGKAFSVRSNMKRHERGCHTDGMPGVYPTSSFARSP